MSKTKQVQIGYYQAPPVEEVHPYTIPPRRQVVELVIGGKVRFAQNDQEEVYGEGTIFWHVPGDKTICKTFVRAPYSCLAIHFFRRSLPKPPARVTMWEDLLEMRKFVSNVVGWYHDETFDRDVLCQYAYAQLQLHAYEGTRKSIVAQHPSPVRAAVEYVESHFDQPCSLEELSASAGISIPHLHKLFRVHLGVSPHRYVLEKKLYQARQLLSATNTAIKQISVQCGFASLENFYRVFQKHMKISPAHYRKQYRPPNLV